VHLNDTCEIYLHFLHVLEILFSSQNLVPLIPIPSMFGSSFSYVLIPSPPVRSSLLFFQSHQLSQGNYFFLVLQLSS